MLFYVIHNFNVILFLYRYPNLNSHSVTPAQVLSLVDTDDPEIIKQPAVQAEIDIPKKRRRRGKIEFKDRLLNMHN